MNYNFKEIESRWRKYWADNEVYKVSNDEAKPKFYVLDMFPYPSGAGLHVGHPLGYIASDIYSRYKRQKGFNVLHPQGYDSFGLPAEQYAIQTGQHPEKTTKENIARYREQLDKIGFSFDWSREIRTSNTEYYKWTQWIFIQLFHSWYNKESDKAEDIANLVKIFEQKGNANLQAVCDDDVETFSAQEWNSFSEEEKQRILLKYRLTYLAETEVNWCPALGTVLANDEVINGLSERGGHPVIRKKMTQWSMRITAYAERLLQGLDTIDWSESIKESQRNWIGKSQGAMVAFRVLTPESSTAKEENSVIRVFTTRPDTIFGVTYLTLAPEHELVLQITTDEQKQAVLNYIESTAKRSERDRMADTKTISGVFTGAYATHPLTGQPIPIWIGDYVLAGYGTGAVMAVPAGDERDYAFAKHFAGAKGMPEIINIFDKDISESAYTEKGGFKLQNSEFLNGMDYKAATEKILSELEKLGAGERKTNYRLRDAVFSRQRYWGEPFPIYYVNGLPQTIDEQYLPIALPEVEKYLPTEDGQPPLGNATTWAWDTQNNKVVDNTLIDHKNVFLLELNTMPGWAGSSWYWLRYMDAHNNKDFVSVQALNYWQDVDLYIGGREHATGHLLYSRFWNKFLKDKGFIKVEEPFKKLINQGMIQGRSNFVYRINGTNTFVSLGLKDGYETTPLHVDVNIVSNDVLDIEKFRAWRPEFADAQFVLEGDKYVCGYAVEKMSKSMYNVVNPDDIVERYGADTLRMYEMFLGPLEQSKPWDTNGIDGVHRFFRKLWSLFYQGDNFVVTDEAPTAEALKSVHKLIKKVTADIENFSFNTSVSAFMICVNELISLKCQSKEVLSLLVTTLSPFAPHIAEELWHALGNTATVCDAPWAVHNEEYLKESSVNYTISFNGKARYNLEFAVDADNAEIEKTVLNHPSSEKWLEGKAPKKVIIVPKKIVNVVV